MEEKYRYMVIYVQIIWYKLIQNSNSIFCIHAINASWQEQKLSDFVFFVSSKMKIFTKSQKALMKNLSKTFYGVIKNGNV